MPTGLHGAKRALAQCSMCRRDALRRPFPCISAGSYLRAFVLCDSVAPVPRPRPNVRLDKPPANRYHAAMKPPNKTRLDLLLVARGLAATRERAQALVLAGEVLVDGAPADKPAMPVAEGADAGRARRPALRQPRRRQAGPRRWTPSPWTPPAAWPWTSAPPPAASPTACCSAAPPGSMPWTWATASSTGGCARTPAWSSWTRPTSATWSRCPSGRTWPWPTSRSSRCAWCCRPSGG